MEKIIEEILIWSQLVILAAEVIIGVAIISSILMGITMWAMFELAIFLLDH